VRALHLFDAAVASFGDSCLHGALVILWLLYVCRFAVVVGVGMLEPSAARASCGDWLAGHDTSTEASGNSAVVTVFDVLLPPQSSHPRCLGPSCGKLPNPLEIPLPPTGASEDDRSGSLTEIVPLPPDAVLFNVPSDDFRPPTVVGSPPEHPPRLICVD
jgi:hypothetical protein